MSKKTPDSLWRACQVQLETRAKTVKEEDSSVEVVATTDAPVPMQDSFYGAPFMEVLAMGGLKTPKTGQVPLLDSHERWSTTTLLGSFKEFRVEENSRLVGRVYFSSAEEGQKAFLKLKEGHLTDFSVGYIVNKYAEVGKNETLSFKGKEYKGPCKVATDWELKELSICPIGADPEAKARGAYLEDRTMTDEELRKLKLRAEAADEEEKAKRAKKSKSEDEEEEKDFPDDEDEEEEAKGKGKKTKKSKAEDDEEEKDFPDDEEEEEEAKGKGKKTEAGLQERARIVEIDSVCRAHGLSDRDRKRFIASGASLDEVRRAALDIYKIRNSAGAPPRVQVIRDSRVNFMARAIDALTLRAGFKADSPTPGYEEFRGYTLRDLARQCLREKGQSEPASDSRMVSRALTTTDLPLLLIETINRTLIQGFAEKEESWTKWTGEMSVGDFKKGVLLDTALDNELLEMGEQDEYESTEMAEKAEEYSIKTFGRKYTISRQSIINDDLGALVGVPTKLAQGVLRLIGDAVYNVFEANSAMGDGKPLFNADHANMYAIPGSDSVPTVESLGAALYTLESQTDLYGHRLNIQPAFLLFPLRMRTAVEKFFASEFIGTQGEPNIRNIFFNYLNRIYEPRLDDQNDGKAWYIIGPKDMGVRVLYLNGIKVPYVESQNEFNIDGVTTKVRFDFGVKAISWRAMVQAKPAE
jgi:hypothetical protein